MTDREDLEVGDRVTLVITETNEDKDKDPISQIDGTVTFIRFPDDYTPRFGETVRAKIADIGDTSIVAVAQQLDKDPNES